MSIFKRIGSIIRSNKEQQPLPSVNPFEDAKVGDIVTVDLEEYVVSGKVAYFDRGYAPHRFAYYLQSGRNISCLVVEKGRQYECFLCEFIEGALDNPNDVPTRLDVDGEVSYDLESHRSDMARSEGNTDFRSGDEVLVWRYFSSRDRYFFLQWQDGKFIALQGERTPAAEVKWLKSAH
ncbi:DUF4178 domain-containing protein [Paenibacillus cymbidii]|uniref:DUF4178 domain-containing protein n=1 Tax=Paenibacillus cymbidii TaxID=1639034 RepID=UPI001081199C|nr:DUF4178 domain-containing protein [Paenibacillus cymbidii]